MSFSQRLLLGGALSWTFSVTLGLLYAARASGQFSLKTLTLPGVIQVAAIMSTAISILVMPLAIWSVRTGPRNLRRYAPLLWITLSVYIVAVPGNSAYKLWGLLFLALSGLVVLGLISAAE